MTLSLTPAAPRPRGRSRRRLSEEAALLAAIIAEPDEDTPRLAYADWLDENSPDQNPSPAPGGSARAEFIRVQCRLAADPFDDPDYPELLERELDLSDWLTSHEDPPEHDFGPLVQEPRWYCRRGFPETFIWEEYLDTPEQTVESLVDSLEDGFANSPSRSLKLIDVMSEEVVLLSRRHILARIRGLWLDGLADRGEEEALSALASSRWASGLRSLSFDHIPLDRASCRALAASSHLRNLQSFTIKDPIAADSIREFSRSKWFFKLRRLHLWLGDGDGVRALAELPAMPRLRSLTLSGFVDSGAASLRRFAASRSFPALARLELDQTHLSAEQVALLARGRWPLRHLRLFQNEIRKTGIEALLGASFAPSLSVLDLRACELTASAVQELAAADALAGLRHLSLAENPIGPGGLDALGASSTLRGLRKLELTATNTARGPIAARDVHRFLSAVEMPDLQHLDLGRLPVGARGARALATSPTFANLTRLHVDGCSLGEGGTRHIIGSPILSNLVALDMYGNKTGRGAGKLLNVKVLPKLGSCCLGSGVPKGTATRLRRRTGLVV
jgi:uncharacterized protein (TIGR02996 family)